MIQTDTIYADYAATAPLEAEVLEAMLPWMKSPGNPSALYAAGRAARDAIDRAREQTAKLLNASPEELVFTASGTEADNAVLRGIVSVRDKPCHIVSTQIEHPAILQTLEALQARGTSVSLLPCDGYGTVSPAELVTALRPDTALVSVMTANNEIGTLQPLPALSAVAHAHSALFHTDAIQAAGHIPLDVRAMGIDSLSLSGHKLGGPQGVGALYIRRGLSLPPLLTGGGQEQNRRSGTENVAGIVGLGTAAALAQCRMSEETARLTVLRDKLIRSILQIPRSRLTGHPENRLPGTASFCFEGIEGESLVLTLDMLGVCASSGSACSAGKDSVSHVLLAIGLPSAVAQGSLRLSIGAGTTDAEIDRLADLTAEAVAGLRAMSPTWDDLQRKGV